MVWITFLLWQTTAFHARVRSPQSRLRQSGALTLCYESGWLPNTHTHTPTHHWILELHFTASRPISRNYRKCSWKDYQCFWMLPWALL